MPTFDTTFAESMSKQIAALSKRKYGAEFGALEIAYVEDSIYRAFKSAVSRKKAKQESA